MIRYPHYGVFSYQSTGTFSTIGIYVPGTAATVGTICDCQPNPGRYTITVGGDMIPYSYHVFAPLMSASIQEGASFTPSFAGDGLKVLQLFNFQTHTEIWC